jgi:plastocyanin
MVTSFSPVPRWNAAAVLALAVLAGLVGALAPRPLQAAVAWQATVGAQSRDEGIQLNEFFPDELWVDAGDSVRWTWRSGEIHTVTFLSGGPRPPLTVMTPTGPQLNPKVAMPAGGPTYDGTGFVNSGLRTDEAPPFTLTLTRPGDFPFVCLVHRTMSGTLHVRRAGTPYPHDQAFYDRQARIEQARLLGEGARLTAEGLRDALAGPGHDQVTAGIGRLLEDGSIAVVRFLPERWVIRAGQTVRWTNRDPEFPHTITFGPEPAGGPFGAFFPMGTDAPGHATIRAPGQAVNSGFTGVGLPAGTQFSVTFTTPGSYSYICAIHDELGMHGTIIVLPAR